MYLYVCIYLERNGIDLRVMEDVFYPKALFFWYQVKAIEPQQQPKEFRLPIGDQFDKNIKDIPKGKITVVEALTLLNNHKLSPETWTAEKITQEYHLELKDVNSLLKYFVTFEVKIVPPEDRKAIQSK